MRIKPLIGSVVGETTPNAWGQVLLSPDIYGVVEINDPDSVATAKGISTLTHIGQLAGGEITSLTKLEDAVKRVATRETTTVLLLKPVGEVMYLVLHGAGAVYLKRGDKIAPLLAGPGAVSGVVKEKDIILLVSKTFIEIFNSEELTAIFDHLNAVEAAEKLTLLLHEKNAGFGAAGLIFEVNQFKDEEEEELGTIKSEITQEKPLWKVFRKSKRFGVNIARQTLPVSWRQKLAPWLRKIKNKISGENNFVGIIALIFGILFIVSVVMGISKQISSKQDKAINQAITEAQRLFNEGTALIPLSPLKGRERLTQAKEALVNISSKVSPRTKTGLNYAALLQKINDNLTQALQVNKSEPQLFFDAGLLKKNASVSTLSIFDGNLAMYDSMNNALYVLSITSKQADVVAGGENFSGTKSIALYSDKLYAVTDNGINQVRLTDNKTVPNMIKKDSSWGKTTALSAFGGNLYLLDTNKSRIWKYVATESGFSDLREYLNPDTLPTLTDATNMSIDGSVWLGTTSGKIWRFTQGKENTFIIQGVDPALGKSLQAFASDSTKNLYILDNSNKRVVVLDKEGIYVSQYVWSGNFSAEQILVSENDKVILLLSGGKIFSISLNQ